MIKNGAQLAQTEERLRQIEMQLQESRSHYSVGDYPIATEPLQQEASEVRAEIDEFQRLSSVELEEAVESLAQEGVLLENIGELLAKLRIASKLTQAQLAERLGWDQPNVSRFESARYSGQSIEKISGYLDALGIWLLVKPSLTEKPLKLEKDLSTADMRRP